MALARETHTLIALLTLGMNLFAGLVEGLLCRIWVGVFMPHDTTRSLIVAYFAQHYPMQNTATHQAG